MTALLDFFKDNEIAVKKDEQPNSAFILNILSVLTTVYFVMIFVGLPLYYHNKYFDIGNYKYYYFYYVTGIYIIISAILLLLSLIVNLISHNVTPISVIGILRTVTLTDKIVMIYFLVCLISFILSKYNTWVFFGRNITNPPLRGCEGWFMGLISQFMFVYIYFLASRALRGNFRKIILFSILLGSFVVFVFGILHRFLIDPLGLYEGIDEYYFIYFLSTLGQSTWYSSFMCSIIPIPMALFIYETRNKYRLAYAVYIMIASMSLVTQNSDSAFIALFAVLIMLLLFSVDANNHLIKYLQLILLILFSFRLTGLLQLIFKDHIVENDAMSVFFSQGMPVLIFMLLIFAVYLLLSYQLSKRDFFISKYPFVRYIIIFCALIPLVVYLILAILVTTGYITERTGILSASYFMFDDRWGSQRGFTWRTTMEMYADLPFQNKLIGVGPDCYADYAYEHRFDDMSMVWGGDVLANAHNEWLNSLFTLGIAGVVSYLGIFVSAAYLIASNKKRNILTIGISTCIVSYIVHNFFCYQQVLCTPVIFLLMGFAVSVIRNQK
ncbi:MAG: O-antigen ligase family protein [Lachnospiraceae bacterium]|nr:O-antigen ligase family protein [Lachnospiraceae bacterium]